MDYFGILILILIVLSAMWIVIRVRREREERRFRNRVAIIGLILTGIGLIISILQWLQP